MIWGILIGLGIGEVVGLFVMAYTLAIRGADDEECRTTERNQSSARGATASSAPAAVQGGKS